jgi:hypothetical protein
MKCYIIHSSKDDVSVITKILNQFQIGFSSTLFLRAGEPWVSTILEEITNCDFVVAVISGNDIKVYYELGIAHSSNKNIFVIAPETQTNFELAPSLNITYIRAMLFDEEKIRYGLTIFLKNSDHISNNKPVKKLPRSRKNKKFLKDDQLSLMLSELKTIDAIKFEFFLANLFEIIGVKTIVQNRMKREEFTADFSLWIDELEPIVGNPVIVEAKHNPSNLTRGIAQLESYLTKYNGSAGLLIYNDPIKSNSTPFVKYSASFLIALSAQELIKRLSIQTLPEIIIELRNLTVHRASS